MSMIVGGRGNDLDFKKVAVFVLLVLAVLALALPAAAWWGGWGLALGWLGLVINTTNLTETYYLATREVKLNY